MRIFLVLLFIIALPFSALKAEVSYALDPGIVKVMVPAGGAHSGVIKVYARSPQKIKVKVYAGDWLYTENNDGARDFFPAKSTVLSCADWITFGPAEFVIAPYEIGAVNYVLRPPQDARGGHYAALFFETSLVTPAEALLAPGQGVRTKGSLNLRLATVFYVDVKGTVKRAIDLNKLSLSKDPEHDLYVLTADFKNTGNADVITGGTFHIMDKKERIVARGKFNNAYTMPGDKAGVTAEYKKALPEGMYNVLVTLTLSPDGEEARRRTRAGSLVREVEITIGEKGELISSGEFR